MQLALLATLFLSLSGAVHGVYNITVDNTDTSIVYTGFWGVISLGGYDYGGTQNLVDLGDNLDKPGADSNATFIFTGIAIYYMAPLWPYRVETVVTLDNEPPVVINMTAPGQLVPIGTTGATVVSSVLWGRTGLTNTQHKLVMSLAEGGRYIVVDALIYTAVAPAVTTGSASRSSASASSTGSTSSTDKRIAALIAVAITMGSLFGLTLVAIIIVLVLRARQQPKSSPDFVPVTVDNSTISPFLPDVVLISGPGRQTDKGMRMYGHSSSGSNTINGAGEHPSPSVPLFPIRPHGETASVAMSAGPPPYQ